jgi:hypothetical protein
MKLRDAILGVLALVLLIGGVVLSQRLTSRRDQPGAGPELDLSLHDGELLVDDIHVAITASPRPVQPMKPVQLALAFRRGGQPVAVEAPRLSFNMVMDMGPHDYALRRGSDVSWVATDVVLPTCQSGGRQWFGTLRFGVDGQPHLGRFRLELQRPAEGTSAPAATTHAATDAGHEDGA